MKNKAERNLKKFYSWDMIAREEYFTTVLLRTVRNRDRLRILGHDTKRKNYLGEDVKYRVRPDGFHDHHERRPRFHVVLKEEWFSF